MPLNEIGKRIVAIIALEALKWTAFIIAFIYLAIKYCA